MIAEQNRAYEESLMADREKVCAPNYYSDRVVCTVKL